MTISVGKIVFREMRNRIEDNVNTILKDRDRLHAENARMKALLLDIRAIKALDAAMDSNRYYYDI